MALSLLLCAGCDITCAEQEEVVELVFSDPFYDYQAGRLDRMRGDGWDCNREGAIRNAFGNEIGSRYRCTRCD